MKKKNEKTAQEAYRSALPILAILLIGLAGWYLYPEPTITSLKQGPHRYARAVITKVNDSAGKMKRVHRYEFEVKGIAYEGSVGAYSVVAAVGDSCTVIYDPYRPTDNRIYTMDRSYELSE